VLCGSAIIEKIPALAMQHRKVQMSNHVQNTFSKMVTHPANVCTLCPHHCALSTLSCSVFFFVAPSRKAHLFSLAIHQRYFRHRKPLFFWKLCHIATLQQSSPRCALCSSDRMFVNCHLLATTVLARGNALACTGCPVVVGHVMLTPVQLPISLNE